MKQLLILTALTATLALCAAPGAQASDGSIFLSTGNANPVDGLVGYHVFGTEANNRGFSIDWGTTGVPGWSLGLDTTYGDCYLFNYGVNTYQFRMRGDTGQLELGPSVPHPASQQQVNITAGTSSAGRTGIGVGTYGNQAGLYLYQISGSPTTLRTQIALNGVYAMGTDSTNNNLADWWLGNSSDQHKVLVANANDSVSINYGATIAGTTTLTGPVQLTAGSTLGFYGASPQSKPTITGSRSDGTALASLLSQLSTIGLVTDQTTP